MLWNLNIPVQFKSYINWLFYHYSTNWKIIFAVPNPCAASPCVNGGSCIDSFSKYKGFPEDWDVGFLRYLCVCPLGFSGQNCEGSYSVHLFHAHIEKINYERFHVGSSDWNWKIIGRKDAALHWTSFCTKIEAYLGSFWKSDCGYTLVPK